MQWPAGGVYPWDAAQLGLTRCSEPQARQAMQQACAERLTQSLEPSHLPQVCSNIDKIFCSAWLSHDTCLVGTKCNKLRRVHVPTRTWQEVAYPEQPVHRLGPDVFASGNRTHCGQHSMAVSPSGAYLVTGGTAAEDVVLWRLQDAGASTSSSSSSLHMQPLQTFMGHADWVFGIDWLSDKHWVSGSRDGTIKLWQVPEAASAPGASYSTDPGLALLSIAYHTGKVRDIKYDQQQQQVVALATDDTVSWWTPDLQLKGSCRLSNIMDAVTLTTCGDLVAIGSSGMVTLLDTRAPVSGGVKRGSSSSHSLPGSKRSRTPHGQAEGSMGQPAAAAAAAAAPAAAAAAAAQSLSITWLPQAYAHVAAVRPAVLALSGHLEGMQQLQTSSAAAGIDPVLTEQLLRQEAATAAVSSGTSFDSVLQGMVARLLRLRPGLRQQELTALKQRHAAGGRCAMQHMQHSVPQQQAAAQLQRPWGAPPPRRPSMAFGAAGWRQPGVPEQYMMPQPAQEQQQPQLLADDDAAPDTSQQGSDDDSDDDGDAEGGGLAFGWEEEGQDVEGDMDEEVWGDEDEEAEGSGEEEEADQQQQQGLEEADPAAPQGPQLVRLREVWAEQIDATLQARQLPDQLRYFFERAHPLSRYATNAEPNRALPNQQQQQASWAPLQQCQGPGVSPQQARVSGRLGLGHSSVRSVGIQNSYILGVGHTTLDFYDLRRIQGGRVDVSQRAPDSNLLLKRVDMQPYSTSLNPVLVQAGYDIPLNLGTESAVYSHCWDPTGTRVLAAGGALALGFRGAFMQLLT